MITYAGVLASASPWRKRVAPPAGRDVSTWSAPSAGGKYAVGDIVSVQELGFHTLARVERLEGGGSVTRPR